MDETIIVADDARYLLAADRSRAGGSIDPLDAAHALQTWLWTREGEIEARAMLRRLGHDAAHGSKEQLLHALMDLVYGASASLVLRRAGSTGSRPALLPAPNVLATGLPPLTSGVLLNSLARSYITMLTIDEHGRRVPDVEFVLTAGGRSRVSVASNDRGVVTWTELDPGAGTWVSPAITPRAGKAWSTTPVAGFSIPPEHPLPVLGFAPLFRIELAPRAPDETIDALAARLNVSAYDIRALNPGHANQGSVLVPYPAAGPSACLDADHEIVVYPVPQVLELRYRFVDGQGVGAAVYVVEDASGEPITRGVLDTDGFARVLLPPDVEELRYFFESDPDPYTLFEAYRTAGNPYLQTPGVQVDTTLERAAPVLGGLATWLWGRTADLFEGTRIVWEGARHVVDFGVQGAIWIGGVLAGDFNSDPSLGQIVVRGAISMIPVVDQVLDLQDICAGLYMLIWKGGADDPMVWAVIAITIIGCIPAAGSAVKTVLKIVWNSTGKVAIGALFEVLNGMGKGNAFKFLEQLSGRLLALGQQVAQQLQRILQRIIELLRSVAQLAPKIADAVRATWVRLEKIRDTANGKLDELFGQIKRRLDEALTTWLPARNPARGNAGEHALDQTARPPVDTTATDPHLPNGPGAKATARGKAILAEVDGYPPITQEAIDAVRLAKERLLGPDPDAPLVSISKAGVIGVVVLSDGRKVVALSGQAQRVDKLYDKVKVQELLPDDYILASPHVDFDEWGPGGTYAGTRVTEVALPAPRSSAATPPSTPPPASTPPRTYFSDDCAEARLMLAAQGIGAEIDSMAVLWRKDIEAGKKGANPYPNAHLVKDYPDVMCPCRSCAANREFIVNDLPGYIFTFDD